MGNPRILTDFDFVGHASRNRLEDPVSSDYTPTTGNMGLVWFNTTTSRWMYSDGTNKIDPRNRQWHSGTQTASTISDLDATIKAYRLDQFLAPNANLSIGAKKLTSVADPTAAQDAATKNYVDAQVASLTSGQVIKGAVKVASDANVSLSSPGATIDGVSLTSGDIVLLTGQTTASQNGPYKWTAAGSTLVRADNWDTNAEAVLGSYWVVEQGTHQDTYALLTNDTAITLDTTALTFTFIGGVDITGIAPIGVSNGQISLATGTGLTVSSGNLVPDFAVVGRRVTGLIPSATAGIVTVAGAVVTINHGLNNLAPAVTISAYSSPYVGYTQGDIIGPGLNGFTVLDPNNVTGTLPAAPTANQWAYAILG